MEEISLHILDIVENSLAASAGEVRILLDEDTVRDRLRLVIQDDGEGMDETTRQQALDPFFTTKTRRRVGLGLPLLAQAARESGGSLEIESAPGEGTAIRVEFRLSHPDCKPLGEMGGTLGTILAGRPGLDLVFEHRRDSQIVDSLDTRRLESSKSE
jgi:K+-sensing histidine kinase KdpD